MQKHKIWKCKSHDSSRSSKLFNNQCKDSKMAEIPDKNS
jgi:hypothetical protein